MHALRHYISQVQREDAMRDSRVIKLLLLGAGESGKSTLFKQMKKLYGVGWDTRELMMYVRFIPRAWV